MNAEKMRPWLIRWLYATVIAHLLIGIALPWIGTLSLFDGYHQDVEAAFWNHAAPPAARAQQVWWISLFGPTVQGLSLWMGALVRFGELQRSTFAWGALIAGLLLWAPQDMLISLRADAWIHVWIDGAALASMMPPLIWLWLHDRTKASLQRQAPLSNNR